MIVGRVYRWSTDKAIGYESRRKMHLYICEPSWKADGYSFLLINKGDYGGDYRITKPPYSFLTFDYSFVGCGGIVTYTQSELNSYGIEEMGDLDHNHLKELHGAIAGSELMESWQIKLCCDVLSRFL